jgi:hypothetical protein
MLSFILKFLRFYIYLFLKLGVLKSTQSSPPQETADKDGSTESHRNPLNPSAVGTALKGLLTNALVSSNTLVSL